MCVWAAIEILLLLKMKREVNLKLEQIGGRPITREEYGWSFFNHILKEHERLFPDSSKRTLWVLMFLVPVIGLISAYFF
jgi:hypothetical protein